MEYNATREQLIMPEYGRMVQQMTQQLLAIEEPEKQLRMAEHIVDVMGILKPELKTQEEYQQTLWDHLHHMTGYRLTIATPYPKPQPPGEQERPARLPYPTGRVRSRHLGKNLEALLRKGLENTDEGKKAGFVQHIGYYMKLAYATWHKEPMHDEAIARELRQLSDGKMDYEPGGYRVHVDRNRPAGNDNFRPERKQKRQQYKDAIAGFGGGGGSNSGGGGDRQQGGGGFKKRYRKKG